MQIKFYSIICGLILLLCCFFNTKQNATSQTYFIQAPLDNSIIKELQDSMQASIEKILKEELGTSDYIEDDNKWALFFFKKRQAITTYYINDLFEDYKNILFSELDNIKNLSNPQSTMLTSNVKFFGDDNSNLIDLVILIDDPKNELTQLNEQIKKTAHATNAKYMAQINENLYNSAKSERFPYLPHLTIGHLRPTAIKKLIKDDSKKDAILERIKQRIIKTIAEKLSEVLTIKNKILVFDKISIYSPKQREFIKELPPLNNN